MPMKPKRLVLIAGALALLTLSCVVTPEVVALQNHTDPVTFSGWGAKGAAITIEMLNHSTGGWEEVGSTGASAEDGWFSIDIVVPVNFWSGPTPPPFPDIHVTQAEVFNNGNHLKTAAEVNGNGDGIIDIVCGSSC